MKKTFFYALAALSLVATSCNDENDWLGNGSQSEGRIVTLSASIAGEKKDARSIFDVEDNVAVFKWAANDAISVFLAPDNEGESKKFTLTTGGGTSAGEFEGELDTGKGESMGSFAYYPYHADHKSTTFHLPASYGATDVEYVENTNAAYRAEISEGSATFKSIAGVLYVKSKVPTGVDRFVLTADGKKISGDFTIGSSGTEHVINMAEGDNTNNSVTYLFKADDSKERYMTFYIPMPVGTYSNLKVELKQDTEVKDTKTCTTDKVINRGRLVILEELNAEGYEDVDYTKTTTDGKVTYTVYTPTGLQKVNILVCKDTDANITLGADITLPVVADGESNWTPINRYQGVFDGQGHSITGLTIVGSATSVSGYDYNYIGLTSQLYGGTIKNIRLINCSIKATRRMAGAFAGRINEKGTITNCSVEGNSLITTTGYTTDKGISQGEVGGIVGCVNAQNSIVKISHCKVKGNVKIESPYRQVGGIAGFMSINTASRETTSSIIEDCSVENATLNAKTGYVGGIVGKTASRADNSQTSCITRNCTVSGCTIIGNGVYAGGIVGFTNVTFDYVIACTVDNCNITGLFNVGGIIGKNMGKVIGCLAQNTNLTMTSTTDDYEDSGCTSTCVYKEQGSVGGLVGSNAGKYDEGDSSHGQDKLVGSYALNCTMKASLETTKILSVNNVVGLNTQHAGDHKIWDGNIADCFYETSGTIAKVFTSPDIADDLDTTTDVKVEQTTGIDWAIAIEAMNDALKANACHYKWTGTATAPELTPHIWSDTE